MKAVLDVSLRCRGCLLGGAVGDALGAPVEFKTYAQIVAQFGPGGIRDFAPAYRWIGAITDDTQMTVFMADGLLRACAVQPTRYLSHAHGGPSRLFEMAEDPGRESES